MHSVNIKMNSLLPDKSLTDRRNRLLTYTHGIYNGINLHIELTKKTDGSRNVLQTICHVLVGIMKDLIISAYSSVGEMMLQSHLLII